MGETTLSSLNRFASITGTNSEEYATERVFDRIFLTLDWMLPAPLSSYSKSPPCRQIVFKF